MELDNKIEQNFALLSSLLYLRVELRNAGFEQTETIIGAANNAFFEDLEQQNMLDDNTKSIKLFLEKIENMGPRKLGELLKLIELLQ